MCESLIEIALDISQIKEVVVGVQLKSENSILNPDYRLEPITFGGFVKPYQSEGQNQYGLLNVLGTRLSGLEQEIYSQQTKILCLAHTELEKVTEMACLSNAMDLMYRL